MISVESELGEGSVFSFTLRKNPVEVMHPIEGFPVGLADNYVTD